MAIEDFIEIETTDLPAVVTEALSKKLHHSINKSYVNGQKQYKLEVIQEDGLYAEENENQLDL